MSECSFYRYGFVFVIAGASAVGKTTIIRCMRSFFPEIMQAISLTTRKKRKNELHGEHYFFVTEEFFKRKIKENAFIEHKFYLGNWYGTTKKAILGNAKNGYNIFITLDVDSAYDLKKKYPENVILIFLETKTPHILKKRLLSRKLPEEEIQLRIDTNEKEMFKSFGFDYRICVDDFPSALSQLVNIYRKYTR